MRITESSLRNFIKSTIKENYSIPKSVFSTKFASEKGITIHGGQFNNDEYTLIIDTTGVNREKLKETCHKIEKIIEEYDGKVLDFSNFSYVCKFSFYIRQELIEPGQISDHIMYDCVWNL